MADPPRATDTGREPDRGSMTGMPRWMKVVVVASILLALLIVVLMLFGGGNHGPGRHASSGDNGAVQVSVTDAQAPSEGGQA